MLLYIQMRWNIEGRISMDKLLDMEADEKDAAHSAFKVLGMYKVAAQRRVIAIVDAPNADELDRAYMARFPLREYLELEQVWVLRSFEDFIQDCRDGFKS